jgi:hypothetical protein
VSARRSDFAGAERTRYTRDMRFDVRFALPFALLVPCLALACTERQETQQQAPAPQPQPQSQTPQPTTTTKSKFEGMKIQKGVGMPGMGGAQTPTATPETSAQAAPSASASK